MNATILKGTGLLGAMLLLAACASPATDAEGNAVAPRNVSATGEPLICRNEQVTGTNFRDRVCLTAEGWKALQNAERRTATEFGRQTRERAGEAAARQSSQPAGTGI